MGDLLSQLLERLLSAPDLVIFLLLGAMAALENVFPPVPADVIVLFGGALAGYGEIDPWLVFFVVWVCNVGSALGVYGAGRRFGPRFFAGPWGRSLLRPRQLAALGSFYQRFGFGVIFLSRFLPMFRAVVPPFAGVAGVGFWRTALPLASASALWYGMIVYLGFAFGSNWAAVLGTVQRSGRWSAVMAALALLGVGIWWWRSRADDAEGS